MSKELACPKCGFTQLIANKNGFGFGKALVGLLGNNKIKCLNLGYSWLD